MDATARLACCQICLLTDKADCKRCAFYEALKARQEAQRAQDKNTVLSFQGVKQNESITV